MKIALGIILILFASGCVNTSMNAAEIAACIHATQTQVVDVPTCKTNEECSTEWKKMVEVPPFQHLPVKKEMVEVQHHIIQAWNALRNAQSHLEKANSACEKGNMTNVIQNGLPAAGALQTALQSAEKSNWTALTALHTATEKMSQEELERIKDTQLYEHYARALEILHNVATGNETNEWGKEWGKNQEFYSKIGQKLSNQPLPSASFDWKDAFSWYDTGVGIAYPEKKKTIIWFSTIWKSAISSLTKGKTKNSAIALMQSIQAEEMIQSVEISTAPTNGLVIQAISLVIGMEKEWQALEKMESEKVVELEVRAHQLIEKQNQLENETEKKQNQWNELQPFFHAHHVQATWKEQTGMNSQIIDTELEKTIDSAIEKNQPLGQRIERIRKVEKLMNDWENHIAQQTETNNSLENACITLQEKMEVGKVKNEDPCETLQWAVETSTLEWENPNWTIQMTACLEKVNLLQFALGGNPIELEPFVAEFGVEAALPGCESMKMALENQYAQDPLTQTWMENWEKLKILKEAIYHATHSAPNYYTLEEKWTIELEKIGKEPPILLPEEAEEYAELLEEIVSTVENTLMTGLQIQVNESKWKVKKPQPIGLGEVEAEAEIHIPNPFGQSITLNGTLYIQEPISNFLPDDEWISGVNKIIEIENIFLPKTGLTINGKGNGEWNTLTGLTNIKQIIGDEATIETTLSIHAKANSDSAQWNWKVIGGNIIPPIQGKMDGKIIQVEQSSNELEGIISIDESDEKITLQYVQKGIMTVKTTLLKQEEDEESVNEWYDVTISNTTEHPYSTTIKTGIISPFSGTFTILALDESGYTIPYSIGVLGDIILQDIAIPQNGHRTVSILLSKENEEGTPFIQEVLENEISQWLENENALISAEAQKLWNKIHTNTNPEKWPALAQEVMQLKEKGEEIPQPTQTIIQKPIQEEHANNYLEEMHEIMSNAKEKMEKYKKSLGITCAKLSEVGYYCPIDEKTLKEWNKEWDIDTKKEEQMRKRNGSEKTTNEQKILDEEEAEKNIDKWKQRDQNTKDAIEEVEKTARGLETSLKERAQHDMREDVKEAWEKFEQAIQKEEFGKAIFVGKNLHHYFSSENRLSGLVSVPPIGWPLIGIIVIVGGIFIRKEWKKKKIEPIELKPLPEVERKTNPPRAPRGSDESSPLRTREEFR